MSVVRLLVALLFASIGSVVPSLSGRAAEPPSEPLLRIETGMHTAQIWRIAVDAAGRYLVTGSEDKSVRVWELASGKLLQILRPPQGQGDEGKVYAVALSPDASIVAVGGWTGYDWDTKNSIYLFDRASGHLLRRLPGLPQVILHLAFSPDGQHLAAALGGAKGIRAFRTRDWQQVGADSQYEDSSYCVDFDRSGRLLATSDDGYVRLYDRSFKLVAKQRAAGGKQPFFARFSPDGHQVAVGFNDSTAINVLSGEDLKLVFAPDTRGIDNGSLSSVTWSRDGQSLYAAGRYRNGSVWLPVLHWNQSGRGAPQRLRAATNTVMDLQALSDGRVVFVATDPAWGMLDAQGTLVLSRRGEILDLRGSDDRLRLSATGSVVEFGFVVLPEQGDWVRRRTRFDVSEGRLEVDVQPLAELQAPRTGGEPNSNWSDTTTPHVGGQALKLADNETSYSLAFATDGKSFVLGTNFSLRFYDSPTQQRWRAAIPSHAFAVNVSGDGRYVVAALGDGTLRWYETKQGREALALFVHPDGQRWVAWTPEGFFNASPGAEKLTGYHLNRGKDQAGEFVSAEQLTEQFLRPGLIAQRLTPAGDAAMAQAVAQVGDVRAVLAGGLPPEIELLSPAETSVSEGDFVLRFKVKDRGGGIGKVVYRIDGQEVEGRPEGIGVPGKDPVSRRLPLAPAPGARKVEVVVYNARNEVASRPGVSAVQVRPGEVRPALHVLSIGVTDYRDRALAQGVKFAAQDARAVAAELAARGEGWFGQVFPARVLVDREATRQNIEAAFEQLGAQVQPRDVFVLYLAGHGFSENGEYYFIPWEVRYTSRDALVSQSLGQDRLRALLSKIAATKTVVLLDTCSSGAFTLTPGRAVDEKGAIDRLGRISGRAIIAATADEKMALEGEGDHGVFTAVLLRGLGAEGERNNSGLIELTELAEFLDDEVPKLTSRRWGYEQFPMLDLKGNAFPIGRRPASGR